MPQISSFDESVLEAVCGVLGDTAEGLTGSEIGQLLKECNINDHFQGDTKRPRREAGSFSE